jgi:hypothetical protein
MSLKNYKDQNTGLKTVNLDGILFLINDSCDEFGQHYENKIITPPYLIRDSLLSRENRLKKNGN